MIAISELHNLIRSLNKPEKRFFKLLSATENFSTTSAITLFDHLERISEKDDVYYKTDKTPGINATPENMVVLYNLILKSQRNFYSETITGFTLNDELANLKILFEKAQYKQCRKMIKTVKEKALRNEKFSYVLEILELEKQLLHTEFPGPDYTELSADLKIQKRRIIEKEKNIAHYYRLYAQLSFKGKNQNLNEKKSHAVFYTKFLSDQLLKTPESALCRRARFLQMKCQALCYSALKDYKKQLEALIEIKSFMQEDALILVEMPRQYLDVLNTLAQVCMNNGRYSDSRKLISEIAGIINAKKIIGADLYIKANSYVFNLELTLLVRTGKFAEASQLAQTIFEFTNEHHNIFNQEDKSVLFFNLTNFYIYNEDYSAAATVLANSKSGSDKNSHWDLKAYLRIQEMITYYELKEYPKFILAANSANQLVKEKFFSTPTESAFVQFFNETIASSMPLFTPENFDTLYARLKSYSSNADDKLINLNYFNFISYAAHKAGHGKLHETLANHLDITESALHKTPQ
ncbi:MAG: hypothetical protein H0W61_04300 [Bacteroidetes bacterium]|nr:hypothetical protein [Bacteroidota bacterium]